MHNRQEPSPKPKLFRVADALRLTVFGWYFATCLLAGIGGGWALDKWIGSKPLFMLIGLLLGTIVGFYGMYKLMQPLLREKKSSDPRLQK